jgi:indolepyruvate decarboxylase
MKSTIGSFLISRLCDIGVRHVIGVPGDYNLPLLEQIDEFVGIEFVGTCNELGAAYAADGYARLNGAAALITTYGVGELSAINGIAGACAEHVPVVCITGIPPLPAIEKRMLLHHTLGDGNFENMMACLREFTVAQARLTPANAVVEIDRVLKACLREKRPVYLQVPSDITHFTIDVPTGSFEIEDAHSDPERLDAATSALTARLSRAERPALLLDMDAERFGLRDALLALVDRMQMPFAALSTGKCALDESHPLYLGIYAGRGSQAGVRECIENSDCLLAIAPRFIDTNSLWFSQQLPPSTVYVRPFGVTIGADAYEGVVAKELLMALGEHVERADGVSAGPSSFDYAQDDNGGARDDKGGALTQELFWTRVARFIRERDVIVAETGTSRVALMGMRMPAGVTFISQGLWGSIGYTLPALLGAMLATPNRRAVLFIGDGSFQLTAQELSTILRYSLRPIIFLLNNGGYTVERMILGERASHNDVANWDYTKLASVFAAESDCLIANVSTADELDRALAAAESEQRAAFIELTLHYLDAPETLKRAGKLLAEFEYGPRGPHRLMHASARS